MSVAQILEQLAANAGRTQRVRGHLIGDTVAGISQVPAQIIADRERLRIQQLQEARQAEQLGFARNADVRATKDQAAQDAAVQLAVEHKAAVRAGLAAAMGESGDPTQFDGRAAFEAVSKLGKPEAITDVIAAHRAMAPKLTSGAPGSVMRDEAGVVVPGSAIPATKPDYTIGTQRFSGADATPLGAPAPAPVTHSPAYKEWQDYKDTGGTLDFNAYMTADANRKKPTINVSGMNSLYADIDPKAIAAQIRVGQHPPDIGQYGRPAAAAIASELAKKGPNGEKPFDLSSAQREWKAQIRLNSTMNGPQQVRLDESIRSGLAMYDKVDEIAKQWDSLGIGPLSRANLAAARDGLKGQKAASIANQLTGQIGQLTSDIATIEQGGLTPTNEARAVAEKSLQDWWGKGTILDMTQQGRYNMQIRHTARNTQDIAVPGNAPDLRPAAPATPVAAAGGAPAVGALKPLTGPGYPPDAQQQFDGKQWIRIK